MGYWQCLNIAEKTGLPPVTDSILPPYGLSQEQGYNWLSQSPHHSQGISRCVIGQVRVVRCQGHSFGVRSSLVALDQCHLLCHGVTEIGRMQCTDRTVGFILNVSHLVSMGRPLLCVTPRLRCNKSAGAS